jgi:hypothetical protein
MPTRRSAETTPDLFSAPPTTKAPAPLATPQSKANTGSLASQPRHFLPKDLAGALKRLDDTEIDALLVAVSAEAERRGRMPSGRAKEKPTADHWFVDDGQTERSARRFQGWRQAFGDCAAVRDFTDRYQDGARHRGSAPKIWSLTGSMRREVAAAAEETRPRAALREFQLFAE